MKVFYGLTNYSQFNCLPEGINVTISARWLMKSQSARKSLYKYRTKFQDVMLDSGAFGAYFYDKGYTYTPEDYLELVDEVNPDLWVTMDVPCDVENSMVARERIEKTVENTQKLYGRHEGFISVIQGWEIKDYIYCINLLQKKSLLTPIVGIGSICRRFAQREITNIARNVKANIPSSIKLHGFGIKISSFSWNFGEMRNYFVSIDTAAWQFNIKKCSEIPTFFARYQKRLQFLLNEPYQLQLL